MSPVRRKLSELRVPLLELHRVLLESERRQYEIAHGRVTPHELLSLALKHQQFAWLLPLSALIVRIDELLGDDAVPSESDLAAIAGELRARLTPAENGTFAEQRYDRAMQSDPGVVLAHRAVMQALPR
jgi:hypothetical protein